MRYRADCRRRLSVGGGEDNVGGLDDGGDLLALVKAELAGGRDGDRGDQALAVDASSTLAIAAPSLTLLTVPASWLRALSLM
jgi:hypothetical protein